MLCYIIASYILCLHRVQSCIHIPLNRVFAFCWSYILDHFSLVLLVLYVTPGKHQVKPIFYTVLNLVHMACWSFKRLFCLAITKIVCLHRVQRCIDVCLKRVLGF